MPRRTPPDRVRDVARAACRVFIEKGYRKALMTDVGARLGLSHALLYRYVDSKEALFELALRYAVDPTQVPAIEIPVPTPPPGRALDLVQVWAAEQATFPVLAGALAAGHAEDAAEELAGIIGELYAFVEGNRRLLALIERCALDMPELYAFWFTQLRRVYVSDLATYLQCRGSAGELRKVSDVQVAARFIAESIAWFAWHRRGDADSGMIADEQARHTVTELLLAAFVP
jgi:AcrR family transcriptional regulator